MNTRQKIALAVLMLAAGQLHAEDTVHYYYTDPQGTVLAKADATGNVIATYDYAPYGSQALGTPPSGPGYTGHVNDPDTGLVYMQARYYDPAVGRFLSVDPVGPSPGNTFNFTRYDYANANPINRTDPTGRVTFCDSKFCVTTADTANSHRSMTTIEAGAKIQAAATKGIGVVAVHSGSNEKAGFVEKGSDTVSPAKHVRNGSTATGVTAKVEVPSNAVAMVHGHIDSGPQESNGMVDDPKSNGGYGDTQSLKIGIPQGTVSHGQIGWHEMVDGRLQFSYPAGALNSKQTDQMQNNLNVEQKLFQ